MKLVYTPIISLKQFVAIYSSLCNYVARRDDSLFQFFFSFLL